MRMISIFAASAIVMAACASSPDYREAARSGAQGYSEQVVERDRYRVTYTGDRTQTAAEVRDLATLRAAELTMEKGGDWFEVVSDETTKDTEINQRLGNRGYATLPGYTRSCGVLGCTTRAYPRTVLERDIETDTDTIYDHSIEIVIHEGEKPTDNVRAYTAAQVAANLRATLD